jgi:cardiolipin synthase
MKRPQWTGGNRVDLLENGEQYYPAVFDAIAQARVEVQVQTYILTEDDVGQRLHQHLCHAARRGVRVEVLVDDWGSPDLGENFRRTLAEAGVRLAVFDPGLRMFGTAVGAFRRFHRKLVVVDGELAFIGGLNFCRTHLQDCGGQAKRDYAVRVRGPVVSQIHSLTHGALRAPRVAERWTRWLARRTPAAAPPPSPGEVPAALVVRDNLQHRHDIEHQYRLAIRCARQHILIANAYFFPGYRLVRDLRRAARRGVQVDLVLQGRPDVPVARLAARLLYPLLQRAGVRIHEYMPSALHAKVAVIDDRWATVGSSNLDPTSLGLNLEANLLVHDRRFASQLAGHVLALIRHHCRTLAPQPLSPWASARAQVATALASFLMRRLPGWLSWWPAAVPRVAAFGPVPALRAWRRTRATALG